jgi:hypothetical protein
MRATYHNAHPLSRREPCGRPIARLRLRPRADAPYRPSCQDWTEFCQAEEEAWARFLRRALREVDAQETAMRERAMREAQRREEEPMYGPNDPQDTAEIRLMRSIGELNHRILVAPDPAQRTQLRLTLATLRAELVKLIESTPIHSEADVEAFRASHRGLSLQVAPPRYQ